MQANMGPSKGGCTGSKEGARVHGSLAMNHARRQLRATGWNKRGDQQRQCHGGCLLWAVWSG